MLAEAVRFPRDLVGLVRARTREVSEMVVEEELEAALGAVGHERTGRRAGDRNGTRQRTLTTECGPLELSVPRGRLLCEGGTRSGDS